MPTVTIERFAAERGYRFGKTKEGGDDYRLVTLKKGDRVVTVDDEFFRDIVSMAAPVENPDAKSPIKAVS